MLKLTRFAARRQLLAKRATRHAALVVTFTANCYAAPGGQVRTATALRVNKRVNKTREYR